MAIRNMAVPLLGGGALIVGYAVFSRWRAKRASGEEPPITLRESGHEKSAPAAETNERADGPLSERSPRVSDIVELDALELDDLELLDDSSEREPSLHDAVAPEDIGALFLARATDALSPFGSRAGNGHFDLDQFELERGIVGEATARAANGEHDLVHGERDRAAESERRPSPNRARSRS